MIRHIVLLKLKDTLEDQQKKSIALQIKQTFENLPNQVNQIRQIEVGINFSTSPIAYDIVIMSVFQNEDDLNSYYSHPAHLKAVNYNRNYTVSKVIVDYEF